MGLQVKQDPTSLLVLFVVCLIISGATLGAAQPSATKDVVVGVFGLGAVLSGASMVKRIWTNG